MKKWLSLLLAILMLLPMAAMAAENHIYVDPTDTYSYAYPEEWVMLSKETIKDAMAAYEGNEYMTAVMQNAASQMDGVEMTLVISPDGLHNINLVVVDLGGKVSAKDLLAQSSGVQDALRQGMPGIEFVGDPEILEIGDYEFVLMAYLYSLDGANFMGVQAFTSEGTRLYTFTLTSILQNEDAVDVGTDALFYVLSTAVLN